MLIFAADTSGKQGSIALVRCETGAQQILELVQLQGGTFSAQLIPQLAELLSRHNLSKSDIGAFAVASGPGSFTGLRVGLAAIKALAEVLEKPIAAVSLLEVIAFDVHPAKSGNRVLVALDVLTK
jgi:tRNA threonylcarbamoyladenosine biosynthesis protein TsaB